MNHKHSFFYNPGSLSRDCSCGISQFATRFGLAEYDPVKQQTTKVDDGSILWQAN